MSSSRPVTILLATSFSNLAVTYVVDHQFLFIVLPSQLPDTHLDEILESGVHVDVLVLQLATTCAQFHLLHKPGDSNNGKL